MNCNMTIDLTDRIQTIVRNQPFGTVIEAVYLKPSMYHRAIEELQHTLGDKRMSEAILNSFYYNVDGHMMNIRVGNIQVHNHPMGVILLEDKDMKDVGKFIDLATNKSHYTTRTSYDRPEDKVKDKSPTFKKTFLKQVKEQVTRKKLSEYALLISFIYITYAIARGIVEVITYGTEVDEILIENKYYLLGSVLLLLTSKALEEKEK